MAAFSHTAHIFSINAIPRFFMMNSPQAATL